MGHVCEQSINVPKVEDTTMYIISNPLHEFYLYSELIMLRCSREAKRAVIPVAWVTQTRTGIMNLNSRHPVREFSLGKGSQCTTRHLLYGHEGLHPFIRSHPIKFPQPTYSIPLAKAIFWIHHGAPTNDSGLHRAAITKLWLTGSQSSSLPIDVAVTSIYIPTIRTGSDTKNDVNNDGIFCQFQQIGTLAQDKQTTMSNTEWENLVFVRHAYIAIAWIRLQISTHSS